MPEGPELRIMCDYINQSTKDKTFKKIYHVERGNKPIDSKIIENFKIEANSSGKELTLKVYHDDASFNISVFMGMSGNWKFVPTESWTETPYTRMRLDTTDDHSLLLYGSYMGPKYKLGGFTGVKRGPDPTKQFEEFKKNVLDNLNNHVFNKPICEVLLEQKYFSGVGNYIRSTILYYLDVNPFEDARTVITKNPKILDLCRDVQLTSYKLHGAQLQDWKNPFNADYQKFNEWVFYKKGLSCKDGAGRTFWFHEKWKNNCPYK